MGSNAAAVISAMITSQVYPQLYYPPPARTVARQRMEEHERESEAPGTSAKGTSQAIGIFQITLGIGIIVTLLLTIMISHFSVLNFVMSMTSSIVYMTNGTMSCCRWRCMAGVKRRRGVIRATIVMTTLGLLMALTSIVFYCLSFGGWHGGPCMALYCHYKDINPMPVLIMLLFLTILELGFAIMTAVLIWNHHVDELDLVAFSQEGWRDGERGDDNGKPLRATSPSASP
ncbi:uncharacterized protein LOC133137042 [Conger conger]|uniref:uncharacterized protein LOC133137042 n=1 Tax=Conger conger TaxID=82655 RepID=UPI002A59D5AA|nr:uncharacterized protein LOC133137042 [Conger conger]